MSTPYPIIRFQTDDTIYRMRVFYDGPPEQGTHTTLTLDDPTFAQIDDEDGGLDNYPFVIAAVAAGSVELKPNGGTPKLIGTAEGMGGPLYATYDIDEQFTLNEKPVTVPEGTPDGALVVMCLLFLDLDFIWRQEMAYVPPGWNKVAFDICDGGFGGKGLAMGIYSRTFGPDTPTTFNPFEQDVDLSDPWNIEPPKWVHLEGNWLAQLRVYENASVGDSQTAVLSQAFRGDQSSIMKGWPDLGNPVDLTSPGDLQAQFFCVQQQNGFTLDLAPGGSDKLLSGREVQVIVGVYRDAAVTVIVEVSKGPFFRMVSEDLLPGFQGGNALLTPTPQPPIENLLPTTLHVLVTGGPRDLHATATVAHSLVPPQRVYVTEVSSDTALSIETLPSVVPLREIADIGPFEVGTPLRHDGECDRLDLCASVTPRKFGAPGPLTRPGVNWRLIANGPRFVDDFESQSQIANGLTLPGPRMQIKNGALTTADREQVRTYFSQDVGWYYHGEKYALKWLAPGPQGDGIKLRAKTCGLEGGKFDEAIAGPGQGVRQQQGVWAVVINMQNRQDGLAFFWGRDVGFGWITDLRKLAYAQWQANNFGAGPDTAAGQDLIALDFAVFAENTPPFSSGPETNVSWVEVWRDGNTARAAYYESDPEKGEAPIHSSSHDVRDDPKYGPGVWGYWGVVAGVYLDQDYTSYSGAQMGFDELTLWRAT